MACSYFEKPLTSVDRYQVTVDPNWLEGEVITTATWSTDSDVVISDETISINVLQALFTKGAETGGKTIYIDIETPTRSDRLEAGVKVQDSICI